MQVDLSACDTKNEIPTGAKKQHKMNEWRDFEMMTLMLHDNLNGG